MIYDQAAVVYTGLIKLDKRTDENLNVNLRGSLDCFNLLRTCTQVRSEFLPIYYQQTHFAIPKDGVRSFCTELAAKGIRPSTLTVLVTAATTLTGQHMHATTFHHNRIFARDFLPILETRFKYLPTCQIHVGVWNAQSRTASLPQPTQQALDLLFSGNDRWKNAVVKRHLSQVLVEEPHDSISRVRIVIKVPHEQPWMRRMLYTDREDEAYAVTLGFGDEGQRKTPDYVRIAFGVHY
jgi:hypothetical protein